MTIATRLDRFGETIFTPITALAHQHGAINLGQGFPNFDGPEFVKEAAIEAIRSGHGQYARSYGSIELVEALATRFQRDTGLVVDPLGEVTVTSGCTEGLAAAFLGLIEPGDEVVLIEPTYDAYLPDVSMAGGVPRFVTLRPPDFRIDADELRTNFNARTRAIVINTPHNPTGRVLDEAELSAIADLCIEHDVVAITDEVYDRMVYEGRHVSLASLPGMWERTITLSSLGKSFSLTGWKIGWAIAPPHLTAAVRAAHQYLTFATATPLQRAAAVAVAGPDSYFVELATAYRRRRDLLVDGLTEIGFTVYRPEGTYFLLADHTRFGQPDDVAFVRYLIEKVGVAAIPPSVFYHEPSDGRRLVRFAFCKDETTLREALDRLSHLSA